MIIGVEGIDGAGKGTQIELLARALKAEVKRFPDRDGVYGQLFVNILKKKVNFEMSGESMFPMFLMDMLKDMGAFEKCKSHKEKHLIVDRYVHTTLAYQGAQGFDYEKGKKIIEGFGMVKPDVVIIIDITPEEGMKRLRGGQELFEKAYFLKKVRENYTRIFKDRFFAGQMHWIDGAHTPEAVHESIMGKIKG